MISWGTLRGTVLGAVAIVAMIIAVVEMSFSSAFAQPASEWSVTLGGDADEFAHAVSRSEDGGFVIAGETSSQGAGSKDGWLVKLNSHGVEQWTRTFGGSESDTLYSVHQTNDGGFILAGETHSLDEATSSYSNFWLVKTNSEGEQQWQHSYGSSEESDTTIPRKSDVARAVRETSDGGFVLVGASKGTQGTSVRLVRTDSGGNTSWTRTLNDISGAVGYDIVATTDGFVVVGSSHSADSGSQAFLVNVDATGNPVWTEYFGGSYNDEARSVTPTGDGGYAFTGFTWSAGAGQSDFWLVKADANGELVWERTFGGVLRDSAHSLVQTTDGGFALAGWSESFRGGWQDMGGQDRRKWEIALEQFPQSFYGFAQCLSRSTLHTTDRER